VSLGRHTLTGLLCCNGLQQSDWSADYRFYSKDRLDEERLFKEIRQEVEGCLETSESLVVGMDDSILRKSGPKIDGVGYRRDPLSPPFCCNLVRGQRVLQLSAALPQGQGAARLIPIDWRHAPLPAKPPKKAPPQQWQHYQEERRQANINKLGVERIEHLRKEMDQEGSSERSLIMVVDGRFTNTTVLRNLPERTTLIGRVRKDAALNYLPEEQKSLGRKRLYGASAPSPEQLREDQTVDWEKIEAFAAGELRGFKVKTLGPLLYRCRGGHRKVQLLVIAPLGYRLRKGSKILYRQPAFLICTDPELCAQKLLQAYLWRWDIEVNFRDEKTLLGVGQAQVRTANSNQNLPALAVAAYAMLLLASAKTYGSEQAADALPPPKWRRKSQPQRPSTAQLINQLRLDLWAEAIHPKHFYDFTSNNHPDQNQKKLNPCLPSALFYAVA